ncbi:uncharacterized protein CTHT_0052600 [Thermochaetoides thermophila DSM 1495]|uniref:Uncharacterized protein n=1 Tax=Chaetomium thermophilum (strain DSM 1495 / CBS 144.50 / IMI 039719) TaxID=759272 RepID=G0SDQ3_CHATD|nr:hypothetical protein CTHT_0052600 [Thermochaetoides thermophila DSM 1495]EGS18654.1 hypothetical protein CTHT_0052600 [Thermochaetoides thermophila DSM 1495]
MASQNANRPEVGDILIVIHDFQARSSDELTMSKGDRIELLERDDEFGDGWFLGRHTGNGNTGLFPEVYTRPAPKNTTTLPQYTTPKPTYKPANELATDSTTGQAENSQNAAAATPATLPLNTPSSQPAGIGSPSFGATRPTASQDSQVLSDTINVINEHITDLNTAPGSASLRNGNDSGSEYSATFDNRVSYIQGEETDEEEGEPTYTRQEVEAWTPDQVAEYLFTVGVEKHHCEVFRDQEITGEVLLGMDQTSLFIKALDLGSVGRRLKTWQKIKQLQDEVNGVGGGSNRTTGRYGSEAGSEAGRNRSRTNTVTGSSQQQRYPSGRSEQPLAIHTKRLSQPKLDSYEPVSPVSPLVESAPRTYHDKRPSAASVRDLHHSRRHSSTDFRYPGTTAGTQSAAPKGPAGASAAMRHDGSHKKQPSFDRNWTLGSAGHRPPSSGGLDDELDDPPAGRLQDSAVELDRGYFSGPDTDSRHRGLAKKRDSAQSPKTSYAEEQRVRSGTALSRHSRLGSVESLSPAAQKYYGVTNKRTSSNTTQESLRHLSTGAKETTTPTVTRLDSTASDQSRSSPKSAIKRLSQVNHPDFNVGMMLRSGFSGLRAASDAVTGSEKAKLESPAKDSPMYSPARTGSSTPSAGPSFEFESPDTTTPSAGKSPSVMTGGSAATTTGATSRGGRKKTKQETSAYTRGLQRISPREAIKDADFSGWMKKRSANLMATWKPRLFVLKGRRLAYYYSEDDEMERGLIDISFHRVLPADNERLTGLHATLTGAASSSVAPPGSEHLQTSAETEAAQSSRPGEDDGDDQVFIFKLVPPRAGLSRAVNFTKPTVHYFAVPNVKQGRLWMAALMKATIDRDDTQPVTSTYQQKTISLAKARQMRHRPPALMGLDEGDKKGEDNKKGEGKNGLGIHYSEDGGNESGLGMPRAPQSALPGTGSGASGRGFGGLGEKESSLLPQSA